MKVIKQIYKWRPILYIIGSSALSVSTSNQEIPDRQHLHLNILSTVSQNKWNIHNRKKSIIYLLTSLCSQTTLTVHLSGHSSRCEAEAAVLSISVTSDSSRKMAFNKSLSHALFSEQKPYIQLNAKLKDRASYISLWLRGYCTIPASTDEGRSTVCTHCNIFQQTRASMLSLNILSVSMKSDSNNYLLESKYILNK
jgi:hypothetical protein